MQVMPMLPDKTNLLMSIFPNTLVSSSCLVPYLPRRCILSTYSLSLVRVSYREKSFISHIQFIVEESLKPTNGPLLESLLATWKLYICNGSTSLPAMLADDGSWLLCRFNAGRHSERAGTRRQTSASNRIYSLEDVICSTVEVDHQTVRAQGTPYDLSALHA